MVATVTRLSEAASTVHYFEADGYYARNDPEHRKASLWYGGGVTALGLHGPVKPRRFEQILSGHVPGTKIRLGRLRDGKHAHRPGLDVTFSAPKSISLEALVHAKPKTGAKIVRAHDEAVQSTLDFIENELLQTRGWDPVTRRRPRVKGHGLVAATFRHYASRNLDPQLHTHSVIANMTRNPEGAWRSADFIKLERSKLLIGAFYRSELKKRIEALGYATTQTMVGSVPGFEIAGYTKEHLKAFSTRREEALRWAREKHLDATASVMQQAVLYTRKRKEEPSRAELARLWQERTGELGLARDWTTARGRSPVPREALGRERIPSRLDRERWNRRRSRGTLAQEESHASVLFAVRRAVEHLEERKTVFSDAMLRALVLGAGSWSLTEIDRAIATLVADGHLVEARAHRSDRAFVTDRAVKAEKAVLAWLKEHRTEHGIDIPPAGVDLVLEEGSLNAGQREAVRMLLLPGSRLVGVQGHAGSGKTTMLSEVVALAGADNVIGLAPSSSAALTLGRETGLPTRTLQWLLTRYRDVGDGTADEDALADARAALGGRLLVVDEASLVSMGQMDALLRIAHMADVARVALVGDRRQLRAVEAGQPFRVLQDAGMPTAVMDEVLRQRDSGLKQAVLSMIEGKPGLALDTLGPGVLEMPADELGDHAAALWLDLEAQAREGTRILAPTHARRREINHGVRAGLKAEGSLHGRTLAMERYVNLHLTRSQKGEIGNWHEGDVAVFHHDVYGVRARKGDACRITGTDDGKVFLDHPDGKPRKGDPSGYLRYHVDLFETDEIELQAGERIRWTRNDRERSLLNGEEAQVLSIGHKNIKLAIADGRELLMAHDDPQLHFIDHAYSSTVHAAQGITCDQVIAVLDADHGPIGGQAAFYVELTRARDNAVLLTDDRDQLVEALETASGDELSALEAIGGQFRDEDVTHDVRPKPGVALDVRQKVRAQSRGVETIDAIDGHLLRRLEERHGLQGAAGSGPLSGVEGYAAWREKTEAALDAMREASERLDGTEAAAELRLLLDFDEGVRIVEERLDRLVAEADDKGEHLTLHPKFVELAQVTRVMEAEAPLSARLPADLAALPGLYEEATGAPLPDPFSLDDDEEEVLDARPETAAAEHAPVTGATAEPAVVAVTERTAEPAPVHGVSGVSPQAPDEVASAPVAPSLDAMPERLAALMEERRAMIGEAEGRLLASLDAHDGWRERALAAVDSWNRLAGADGKEGGDAARLGRAVERDDGMADLARRLAAHEAGTRAAGREPMDGLDADLLALDCANLALLARLDGEAPPRVLAGFLERRAARRKEQEKQRAQPAPRPDVATPQPETTAAVRPAPKPARSPATQPAARVRPSTTPPPRSSASPKPAAEKPVVKPVVDSARSPARPAPSAPKPVVTPKPAPPAPAPVARPAPTAPAVTPTRPRRNEPAPSPSVAPAPPAGPDPSVVANAVVRALRDRQALQETADGRPLADMGSPWYDWLKDADAALAGWKGMRLADRQGDADAERLERLMAFDFEADRLAMQWSSHKALARLAGDHPLDHPGADEILLAMQRLRDGAPPEAVLPRILDGTLAEATTHAEAIRRATDLLEPVRALDSDYRALLEREGTRDRPVERRWNRAWSRWRREADALAPVVEELKGLLPHLDRIEGARALIGSLAWTISGKRDFLPGWLLLRLHDNAGEAARQGLNPTLTQAWGGLVGVMDVLKDRLELDDPRRGWLSREVAAHRRRVEAKATIGRVLRRIEGCVADVEGLREKAGQEALPLVQSNAWIDWHDTATMRAEEARHALDRHGNDRGLLGDGTDWAARMEAAIKAIDETVAEHGEPDRSVQARKRVEQLTNPAQKRDRGYGFSM